VALCRDPDQLHMVSAHDGEVDLSVVADVLCNHLCIERAEKGIQHRGVVALVGGQIVVGEVAPGDGRKKALDYPHKTAQIARGPLVVEDLLDAKPLCAQIGVDVEELVVESELYLGVGNAQAKEGLAQIGADSLDAEIARLKEQGHRIDALRIEGGEGIHEETLAEASRTGEKKALRQVHW